MWRGVVLALGVSAAGEAPAQEVRSVAGHLVAVTTDGMGTAALAVDGTVLLEDGIILLDPDAPVVGGVPVVTGVAGAGGNACGAAPFVLALPEGALPALHGPIESCRELAVQVQPEALVFSTGPLPATPGEVWLWTPVTGLTEALPEEFAADPALGWDGFSALAGAHPAEALRLGSVAADLRAVLGAGYAVFTERISDLGSGDLTGRGYLGRACLKFTCDADWALLYLDPAMRQAFVAWAVSGEDIPNIWPPEIASWPDEAMAALRAEAWE